MFLELPSIFPTATHPALCCQQLCGGMKKRTIPGKLEFPKPWVVLRHRRAILLEKLIQDLGMPTRPSDVDINAKDFASIAEKAKGTPGSHNPRKINGPSDVLEILKLAE